MAIFSIVHRKSINCLWPIFHKRFYLSQLSLSW